MWTILKLLGGIQPNYWGDIFPHPPLVSALLIKRVCKNCKLYKITQQRIDAFQLNTKSFTTKAKLLMIFNNFDADFVEMRLFGIKK